MTYQEANALVDDFSFVYKGESISKEMLIECREVIHKALKKQIPKKPVKKNPICYEKTKDGQEYYIYDYHCPICDKKLELQEHHCPCGQALDWSDYND